jgi:hypothetical protein
VAAICGLCKPRKRAGSTGVHRLFVRLESEEFRREGLFFGTPRAASPVAILGSAWLSKRSMAAELAGLSRQLHPGQEVPLSQHRIAGRCPPNRWCGVGCSMGRFTASRRERAWQPLDQVIRRWMRRLRTSKTLGFFEVRFRGKRPWRAFSTAS